MSADGPASPKLGSSAGASTLSGESTPVTPEMGDRASLPMMEVPQTAIAREIVSPDDLIRAIRKGDIAFKIEAPATKPAVGSPWLFDEVHGTFEAPRAEQLTIVIDSDDDDAFAQTDHSATMPVFAGEVVADRSWLDAIRLAWTRPVRNWWWR
jgi:hypothetical protein